VQSYATEPIGPTRRTQTSVEASEGSGLAIEENRKVIPISHDKLQAARRASRTMRPSCSDGVKHSASFSKNSKPLTLHSLPDADRRYSRASLDRLHTSSHENGPASGLQLTAEHLEGVLCRR